MEIKELDQQQDIIKRKVAEIKVIDSESLQQAVVMIQEIKRAKEKVEETRKFFVDPLRKQISEINAKFKPYIDALDAAETLIKDEIIIYKEEERLKRELELEKLRKQQELNYRKEVKKAEKRGLVPPPPPAPIEIVQPKVDGLTMKKVWDFEIIDETKIPREYLTPDLVKIRKVIQAGVRNIEGLRIFERNIVAVTKESELQLQM